MRLSQCQKTINHTWLNTTLNLAIEAGAGSGKTSTLLLLAKNTPVWKKSIFLCFNKSIQQELSTKLPSHIHSSTLHSLGMKHLIRYHKNSFKVVETKTFNIIIKSKSIDLGGFNNKKKQNAYLFGLCKLYELYRINIIQNIEEELEEIALQNDIFVTEREVRDLKVVVEIMDKYNNNLNASSMIDFTDMLYLCKNIDENTFQKYDNVFIDECQDLSKLQKMLVDKIRKHNGRFVSVGDSNQSIYAFCGSNIRSFEAFKQEPNTIELPLNITYRCAKRIVEEANTIFDGMIPFESNPEGQVVGKVIINEDGEKIGNRGDIMDAQVGDLVICRNNSPLVELFIEYLKRRKPAYIYGKDIGEELLRLMSLCEGVTKEEVYQSLDKQYLELLLELEEKHITLPRSHPKAVAFREKRDMIKVLVDYYGNIETAIKSLNTIFLNISTSKDKITLMSIHKSKGLENEKVWFYKPELIPSKYAISDDMIRAEKCLYYVAVTRAKETLIYC